MVATTTTKSSSPIWNSRGPSCLLCAVCESVFTDCRDISTLCYINHLDMVTTTTTKSWSPIWNSQGPSCLLCALCKSAFTDYRDTSTLYCIKHLDMVATTMTKSWSPMWNSRDPSCLLCAVCKSVFTDCRDTSTLYCIKHLDMVATTLRCEIVGIHLVFCVLYVNQSLLIAEIHQHSIASSTLAWLRPPWPRLVLTEMMSCPIYKTIKRECLILLFFIEADKKSESVSQVGEDITRIATGQSDIL